MSIGHPRLLLALLVLLPVIALQVRGYVLGRRDLERLGGRLGSRPDGRLAEGEAASVFLVKWFFASGFLVVALAGMVLAAADISWGVRPVEEDRSGLDVVMAVDVSRSMLVTDIAPNRLERSLAVIRSVTRELSASRVGLVVFKGEAITLVPLTEDLTTLEIVLDGVHPALVSAPGTDVEQGLVRALESFPAGTSTHRAVVLFSDGEALSGNAIAAANTARDRGVPVISVVTGTPDGGPIPAGDNTAVTGEDGRPVISRADAATLARVAELTGGALMDGAGADVGPQLVSRLQGFFERREREGYRLVPVRRYRLSLGIALVSLVLSLLVRMVRWHDVF